MGRASGALNYQCLVDVLDRKGLFSTKTYVECQCISEGGVTICEANPNAKVPRIQLPMVSDRLHAIEQAPCRVDGVRKEK